MISFDTTLPNNCLVSSPVTCFLFNDAAANEIYTLSLHERSSDLGLCRRRRRGRLHGAGPPSGVGTQRRRASLHRALEDRKSTRLNSSHSSTSYAVFCLTKTSSRRISPLRFLPRPSPRAPPYARCR